MRGLRRSRAPGIPPGGGPFQGLGLLQHGLRQAEARGRRRRLVQQQLGRRQARDAKEVRKAGGEEHAGGLFLLRLTPRGANFGSLKLSMTYGSYKPSASASSAPARGR